MEQQGMVQYLVEEVNMQNNFVENTSTMPGLEQFQYTKQLEVPENVEINLPQNLQQVLTDNINVAEEEVEEEVIMDNNFKIRYQEPANTIREEIKQVITTQEKEKTTLLILNQQKADINQQICNIKKLIDNMSHENDLLNKKVVISNEEIQKFSLSMKNREQVLDSLKNLNENVKTAFNSLSQQSLKLSHDYSDQGKKIQEWSHTSVCKILDLNNKIKTAQVSIKKDDRKNIIQQNKLLKQKYIEQVELLENMKSSNKDLDAMFQDLEIKKTKNLELKQEYENKKQSLENLKAKLNHLRENKLHIAYLTNQRDEKYNQLKELEIQTNDIKKQYIESTEAKAHFETLLENKREYNNKLENDALDIWNTLKKLKIDLESSSTNQNHKITEMKTYLDTLRTEQLSIDTEILTLKTKTETIHSDYSKTIEEKNANLLVKCNLEKEMQISEFQKHHYQEHLENRRKRLKELRDKANQLKEDITLQNIIKEKAYLQSSLEYLQEKLNDIKHQDETIQSETKKLQDEDSIIRSQLEIKREEIKSMKLSENIEEIGQGQIMGILKPKAKTPPVSPKTVTFNISSQESVKSSVESNRTLKEKRSYNLESLFDDLLNNAYKNKNMPKNTKKRKLPLD